MKFTLSWLKEHLETSASLNEILECLTNIGLEVEEVKNPGEALKEFRIVEILTADKHPNADRLKLLKVNTGSETLSVVCGDPKVEAGMKGVLAPPGVYVPGLGITLKLSQIRGIESHGMMCTLMELGLADTSEGILQLPKEAPVGEVYVDYSQLNDPRIEIAITPNRGDCLGIRGIARDLAAAGIGSLKTFSIQSIEGSLKNPYPVKLEFAEQDKHACPLFVGRLIKGVQNQESPHWLKKRVESVGVRSISALVDVTNLLAYELGRPMHVFDADKIDQSLTVRFAKEGETLKALNGIDYKLDDSMIIVSDAFQVLSLAGIMGGVESGCTENTKNVYLESALFDPVMIAKTGRKLNLLSDSRYRFERGVDSEQVFPAIERATQLILKTCGGEASKLEIAGSLPQHHKSIDFDLMRVKTLGGIEISVEEITQILKDLGFHLEGSADGLAISVPSWRHDVEQEEDLVEEVLRIYGLNKIPVVPFPNTKQASENISRDSKIKEQKDWITRRILAERGLNETLTWSFLSEEQAKLFGWKDEELRIENPISSDLSIMRPCILPNLIDAAVRNTARGLENSEIFEIGAYYRDASFKGQDQVVAGIRTQGVPKKNWKGRSFQNDIWDAKADALAVLEACGVNTSTLQILEMTPEYYHPGRSAALYQGPKTVLGYFGQLHPKVQNFYDLEPGIVMFEVYLSNIAIPKEDKKKGSLQISSFQPVDRDFAFVVDVTTPAETLLKAVKNAEKTLITDVNLFDVYQGEHVEQGKKSVAIGIRLHSFEKTLTDEEINGVAEKVIYEVEQATGGVLRQ